jgi:hypothetical protein
MLNGWPRDCEAEPGRKGTANGLSPLFEPLKRHTAALSIWPRLEPPEQCNTLSKTSLEILAETVNSLAVHSDGLPESVSTSPCFDAPLLRAIVDRQGLQSRPPKQWHVVARLRVLSCQGIGKCISTSQIHHRAASQIFLSGSLSPREEEGEEQRERAGVLCIWVTQGGQHL